MQLIHFLLVVFYFGKSLTVKNKNKEGSALQEAELGSSSRLVLAQTAVGFGGCCTVPTKRHCLILGLQFTFQNVSLLLSANIV